MSLPPKKRTVYIVDENGDVINGGNPLPVDATLVVSDLEIGAVEIKDGDSDTRMDVEADGGKNAAFVQSNTLAKEAGGNLAAAATSLGVMDDWDESDRAKVNPIAGQAGIQGGAGASTALTTRVAIASDANSVLLPDKKRVAVEKTRPSDTNAYAALDAISESTSAGTVWTFADCARKNNGTGYIVGVRLFTDQTTCTARFRLHLFHTAPTAINDNVAYPLLYANFTNRIGMLDIPALRTEGAGSTAAGGINIIDRLPFVCAAADDDIYGLLETLDAFTPASGQKVYIELAVSRD